jgi:hypothetical protein
VVTAFPFTISAWVRTKSISAVEKSIVSIASGNVANIYYGISLTGNRAAIVGSNVTARINNGNTVLATNTWYHIV